MSNVWNIYQHSPQQITQSCRRTVAAAGRHEVRTWSVSAQGVALDGPKTHGTHGKTKGTLKTMGKSSEDYGIMVF
jgi:hypothetical protein